MIDHLLQLTDADLLELANALRSERLEAPFSTMRVQRIIASPYVAPVTAELEKLATSGFSSLQLATTVELITKARRQRSIAEDFIDLVTSGPETSGMSNRDTSVVVREMFYHAQKSVLVAGYAVYQGQRVFETLADRMEELPALTVRMFLDIQRDFGDTSDSPQIIRRFADRFRNAQWPPNRRLPELFFDPRAVQTDSLKRACLHAKCIVVDRKAVFVSSANFTEAAQERNLEVGLLIQSPTLADRLQGHFDSLVTARLLLPAF